MKIQIKSDLHKETRPQAYRVQDLNRKSIMSPDADVLVLAGDITNYPDRFSLYHELTKLGDRRVIYVPGNHEYYQADHVKYVKPEILALYDNTNVTVLDRQYVTIDDVVFIGATLWTDLSNPLNAQLAFGYLNDFRIPGLTTDWYNNEHQKSVAYLRDCLRQTGPDQKIVVVTHHGPSPLSCHPRYKGDAANCGFHTDLSDLILAHQPQIWIHGHTHDPFDYMIENTRIICNPKGYPGEHNQTRLYDPKAPRPLEYNDDLVIEL